MSSIAVRANQDRPSLLDDAPRAHQRPSKIMMEMSNSSLYWDTRLALRIGEAKELVAPRGVKPNSYVAVFVDDELVARTLTQHRTSTPYYGTEYVLGLANNFSKITLCVCHEERQAVDAMIGQVTLGRPALFSRTDGMDSWHALEVVSETVLSGDIFLELILEDVQGSYRLSVTVVRARDIVAKESSSLPTTYAQLTLGSFSEQTGKAKQSRYPFWDETFMLDVANPNDTLHVMVLNTDKKRTINGYVSVQLKDLEIGVRRREWFPLFPERPSKAYGSVRLSWKINHDLILPVQCYSGLMMQFFTALEPEPADAAGSIVLLEELVFDRKQKQNLTRDEVAQSLVCLMDSRHMALPFLRLVAEREISNTSSATTLFRGNSLATKCIDYFMKLVGLRYLQRALGDIIELVIDENKECEIDPSKLSGNEAKQEAQAAKHAADLNKYLGRLLDRIFGSTPQCPTKMRILFALMRQALTENQDLAQETQYTGITSFLFLRFFAPAVLSPRLFGIHTRTMTSRTIRTLTLLAKALQTVGNLGSTISSGKEAYMKPLWPLLQESVPRVKAFIDVLCDVKAESELRRITTGAVENQPILTSRGNVRVMSGPGGLGKLHRVDKRAEVELTHTSFVVRSKHGAVLFETHVGDITVCETLDPVLSGMKDTLKVASLSDEMCLVTFHDPTTTAMWLQMLRKGLRRHNAPILSCYHAGLFVKGRWSCCGGDNPRRPACAKAHASCVLDAFAHSSIEKAAHTLFSLIFDLRDIIKGEFIDAEQQDDEERPQGVINVRPHAQAMYDAVIDIAVMQLLLQGPASIPNSPLSLMGSDATTPQVARRMSPKK